MVKKAKKEKKLGAVKLKKGAKYFISDPENADRVLELDGVQYVFSHDAVEKIEVSAEVAKALVAKYPYLKAE